MGRDKALLPLGGENFLQYLIHLLHGEVSPLLIVLGHHADQIERQAGLAHDAERAPAEPASDLVVLRNPDYRHGQLSSLQVAVKYLLSTPATGLLVSLVDHPATTRSTIRFLVDRFYKTNSPILIPTYQGRRGHPVIFARSVFQELLDAPLNEGARFVVHGHTAELDLIEMNEQGIVVDVDYPEDYRKFVETDANSGGSESV